ncbi:MAG: ABC transporter ATP-binding protein [Lachnospiraceae bacterium]|nr:ABC transporter ATP-binding protein [Lachnospiraceae bacterium]
MGKIEKAKALWKDRDNQMRYMRWLLLYSKPYLGRIIFMMLFSLLGTGISLLMTLISKRIIDDAIAGTDNMLIMLIVIYFAMIVLMQVFDVIWVMVKTMLNEKFTFGIRKQVYDKILASKWLDVQKYHTGDLMTRLTSDAGNIADGIITTLPSIVTLIIELLLVFFTLFYYSPLLALFSLFIAPVAAVVSWLLGGKMKKLQVKVQESEAAYRSFLQESIANLLIMKSFTNEEYASDRLVGLREDRFYWVYKRTKLSMVSSTIMSMTFQLGYIVAFTVGAFQIAAKVITYGTMSVFLTLVNRVQSPIMQLAQHIPKIVSILASAGRVMELQNIEEEEYTAENITAENIGIKVEHVSFGYTDEPVLVDVNLDIKPGETVAVVGESGIGKTTLIRLIMSFMDADEGKITFYNSAGESETANAGCRQFMSYVPQGNTLISGTIRENIRMGRLDATEEEMIEILKLVAAYDFIMKLPKGLDTVIGEKGHGLSEGQSQRIAIARALIRRAPFLILDEATSALDEATELAVLEGIAKFEPKPTCMVITHRKSVLKYCDKEIMIENKKATEI